MNAADYVILAVLFFSLLFGMFRGFMREALALLGWLGGLWLAWRFAGEVKPMLGGLLSAEPERTWAARTIIFAGVLLATWLIAEILAYFIHQSGLSVSVDRTLGMVFGLIRGFVLVALLALLGTLLHLDEMHWWKKSALMPYAVDVSQWLSGFAESALVEAETKRV